MLKQLGITALACTCLVVTPPMLADSATGDKTLSGWISSALANNPQLKAALATTDITRAGIRAADQPLFNPELGLELEHTDINTLSAGISQTIDWSDKRGARTAVAELEQVIALAEHQTLQQTLATRLLQAAADWQTSLDISEISTRQLTLMERFASLAKRRHEAGDLSQSELGLALLAVADARFQLTNAHADLIRTRQNVAALTGNSESLPPPFSTTHLSGNTTIDKTDARLDALPQIAAARARIMLAKAGVTLRKRETHADPTIGLRLGREDSETLTALSFDIPLFIRNRYQAEVEAAGSSVIQASQELAMLQQQAQARLTAADRIYRSTRESWQQWALDGAPILNRRTELLHKLWQAGELRTTDYLVQLKQTLETEINAINQRGQLWRAWAEWLAATGQIKQWLSGEPS